MIYPHNSDNIFNIGDYVQSIAARQFLPSVDLYLNRERLNKHIGKNVCMVMNGWFMHSPLNWPPTPEISPLFIAFHMNKLAEEKMLSVEGINYLRNHEPIGCRDFYTASLLESKGIRSYFSGCLTLTLGESYKHTDIGNDAPIYFTDLNSILKNNISFKIKCGIVFLLRKSYLNKIRSQMARFGVKKKLRHIAAFYVTYRDVIVDDLFLNAIYREQEIPDTFTSEDDKFQYAHNLLQDYSKARFVVTSRIHCALPCLAMETPVIFVNDELAGLVHNCRLDGLKQLFHTIDITKKGIKLSLSGISKLSENSLFVNKQDYKDIATRLKETCRAFFNKNSSDGE